MKTDMAKYRPLPFCFLDAGDIAACPRKKIRFGRRELRGDGSRLDFSRGMTTSG